ncbi:MAG: hypothetical protein MRERC_3c088 [Mycoplasmataceae bacterium RC_NB112A]|nr:MAG: hypothetical protein MRERC_3c088 [Mycoplasmataceae bacterium RC_NB112A]
MVRKKELFERKVVWNGYEWHSENLKFQKVKLGAKNDKSNLSHGPQLSDWQR